jgi:hypothetical protein
MNNSSQNEIATFEMPDGTRRRIRTTDLPAFAREVIAGEKTKGAEALTKSVACTRNAAGIVRLLQQVMEEE